MRTFEGQTPEIHYPCTWTFRIIGADEGALRVAVLEIIGETEHTLVLANQSSHGRFRSLELELVVRDDAHRLGIYEALGRHKAVRLVL